MHSPGPLPASSRRTLDRLRAVIVLALALPLLGFLLAATYLYRDAFAQARLDLDRSTRIAQEHALKLFDTNEMLLQRMLDLVGTSDDAALLNRAAELHERLKRMTADLPQVQGLYVNGADGRLVASDRVFPAPRDIDYTDREWFKAHREGRVPVFLTEQLQSRTTREPFFDMSRRRNLADGQFAGVVNVSLRPEYLTDFWRELTASEPGLRMAVIREDGRLLAHWQSGTGAASLQPIKADHPLMQQLAANRSSGTADGASVVDGTERMRVFRKLGRYPLYVVASLDHAAVIAEWRGQIGWLAALLCAASGGLGWLAWLAMARTRDELNAIQRLDDERLQRQHVEIALLQSQKLEAMGRLTGGVAHDFNNLLMVISSNLYLHRRLQPAIGESKQLAAIERAIGAGSKLTRQLLAFARKQALLPQALQLQDRLPALMDLLRPLLGSSIALECSVAPDTRPIKVDAAELELALINLAVNARDAMQGTGRMSFSAYNAKQSDEDLQGDSDYVVIDASDTGPGIDPEIANRAFEPFFTTKSVGQGTGLGLSQVRALCQSANGFARIANVKTGNASIGKVEGSGTLVRLFFRPSELPAPIPAEPSRASPILNCHVLLVEDNPAVAQAMQDLLQAMGCRVTCVNNGRAALDCLDSAGHSNGDSNTHSNSNSNGNSKGNSVQLVLSDIEMPGEIDGIALATLIAERNTPLPVLLLTGYAERLEQAVKAQFGVLPKPCSPEVLGEAITKALARKEAATAAAGS